MFLFIDESQSKSQEYTCFGCLCIEDKAFYNLEAKLLKGRVDTKLWGEIKWSKIGSKQSAYNKKYKQLFELYISEPKLTFHSYAYDKKLAGSRGRELKKDPNRPFKQVYPLIKNVIRKCQNHGYKGEYYIIADNFPGAPAGYKQIREYLNRDRQILPTSIIAFCSVADSAIVAGLQMVDICTGIISTKIPKGYQPDKINPDKAAIMRCLEGFNKNYRLGDTPEGGLPDLYNYDKSQHFYAGDIITSV